MFADIAPAFPLIPCIHATSLIYVGQKDVQHPFAFCRSGATLFQLDSVRVLEAVLGAKFPSIFLTHYLVSMKAKSLKRTYRCLY